MGGTYTEMVGPITPLLLCWACLILTVVGLIVASTWTNITAFARRIRNGRKPASGTEMRNPARGQR